MDKAEPQRPLDIIKLNDEPNIDSIHQRRLKPLFPRQIRSCDLSFAKKAGIHKTIIPGLELSLDIPSSENREELQRLCVALHKFKAPSSMTIRATMFHDEEDLCTILSCLKYHILLTSLTLDLYYSRSITEQQIEKVSSNLKHFQWLSILILYFSESDGITDEAVKILSSDFRELVHLSTLKMSFYYCNQITNQGIENLTYGIHHLSELSALNLTIYGCTQISDDGIQGMFRCTNPWSHLSSLILDFSACGGISDRGLENLASGLKELIYLSVLSLTFIFNSLTESSIQSVSSGLSQLKTLSHLKIHLRTHTSLTHKNIIESFSSSLKHLSRLETLNLDIPYGGDKGIETLSVSMGQLPSLTKLALDFFPDESNNKRLTDEGVRSLSSGLEHLQISSGTESKLCKIS